VLEVVCKSPGVEIVVRDDENLEGVVRVDAGDHCPPVLLPHRGLSLPLLHLVADVDTLSYCKS